MKKFRLVDNTLGWLAFLIAAFVYCSTIEPTASFWDCPEFITTGYRLEVGHPPGAPFFALTANLFSHFASDASEVARWVNTMSALLSATCIMFLFWTISHLARKLIVRDGEDISMGKLIAIEGAAMVRTYLYFQRYFLVFSRRRRSLCLLFSLHRSCFLAYFEVGRQCR